MRIVCTTLENEYVCKVMMMVAVVVVEVVWCLSHHRDANSYTWEFYVFPLFCCVSLMVDCWWHLASMRRYMYVIVYVYPSINDADRFGPYVFGMKTTLSTILRTHTQEQGKGVSEKPTLLILLEKTIILLTLYQCPIYQITRKIVRTSGCVSRIIYW